MQTSLSPSQLFSLDLAWKEIWELVSFGTEPGPTFSTQDAVVILKRGISSRVITSLASYFSLPKEKLIDILYLDRTTVRRWLTKDQRLPRHSADSVLRILEVRNMALDVFEGEASAITWMRRQHSSLDGQSPVEATATSFGSKAVKEILVAIKYGGVI